LRTLRRPPIKQHACSSLRFVLDDPRKWSAPSAVSLLPQSPAKLIFFRFSIPDSNMGEALEKIGGSVLNLVLGALILWVGQTTFQHAGVLASVDEKFGGIDQQFTEIEKRHESMRKWIENVVTDMKDNSRSQFTAKEGDKLVGQIRQVESSAIDLERQIVQHLNALEVRLTALETQGQNTQQVAALRAELAQLRYAMAQPMAPSELQYQPATNIAQQPVYLPPVTTQRSR
jgi:hypothetical protein